MQRLPYLLLIFAAASWGIGTVVSKRAVGEFPPLTLLVIQLTASLAGLIIVLRGRPSSSPDPAERARTTNLARLGLLNPGLAYALSLLGLVSISASLSVLLWALEPLLILALAAVALNERLDQTVVWMSALAAAGMVLVLYDPGGTVALEGVVLTVAGVACCAVYTIVARRWLAGTQADTAPVVFAQQAYALALAIVLVGLLAVIGGAVIPTSATALGWASAIGSGLLYYAAAYGFYLSALRELPASTAAASFFLIPVFGMAGARLVLDERLSAPQLVGAVLVVGAVGTILRRSASRTSPRDELATASAGTSRSPS